MVKKSQHIAVAMVLLLMFGNLVFAESEVAYTGPAPTGDMSWWYRKPGEHFWEGMPIGTGRLGAMVLGQVREEVIHLNDETLWSGGPYNSVREGGLEALPEIRKLCPGREGKRSAGAVLENHGNPPRCAALQRDE